MHANNSFVLFPLDRTVGKQQNMICDDSPQQSVLFSITNIDGDSQSVHRWANFICISSYYLYLSFRVHCELYMYTAQVHTRYRISSQLLRHSFVRSIA